MVVSNAPTATLPPSYITHPTYTSAQPGGLRTGGLTSNGPAAVSYTTSKGSAFRQEATPSASKGSTSRHAVTSHYPSNTPMAAHHHHIHGAPQDTPTDRHTNGLRSPQYTHIGRTQTQVHAPTKPTRNAHEVKSVNRIPTDIYNHGYTPANSIAASATHFSSHQSAYAPVKFSVSRSISKSYSPHAQLTASTTTTTVPPTSSRSTHQASKSSLSSPVSQITTYRHPPHTPTHTTTSAAPSVARQSRALPPYNHTSKLPPPTSHPEESRNILNKRLDAKNLNAGKLMKEATSQIKALCVSQTGKCYKITRVLQSAIYGGVFEAEMYYTQKVLDAPLNSLPLRPERKVALKIMLRDLEIQHRDSLQEDITAEFKFEEAMKGHPNVLTYVDLWESTPKGIIYVVMPFAEFEDLFEVLKRRSVPFSEPEARWLFRQLLAGVQHLHNRGVGFRDHSLENVLMFRSEVDGTTIVPKITDPGQAVRIPYDTRHNEVCCLYAEKLFGKSFRPPEVYNPRKYNPIKVDVFCIGWMLFFVVTKRQPFDRTMDTDPHWKYILKGDFEELLRIKGNAKLSSKLISLLKMMLHPDYRRRYTPQECLEDPWFQEPDRPINDRTIWTPSAQ
eukprot:Blabericola_migrator_1__11615@NODE_698_length_6826_cov_185_661340_g507_i0_p1_GENE_NODE_698_length_6826_cov_185_661340_g507_i0NODE_698_length_6826_cov_185_661340_g507_i0_p1_ORF_typecomplete_len616_score63_67Pkinase/PF00069_25/2_4e39Pkinase_Tyr/PF07714_17/1_9e20Kinaselike/PF14531_6/3_5e05Kdo/PF06293_14/0_0002_NODE_698_length_6826_cov_185_661340_g507_i036315478